MDIGQLANSTASLWRMFRNQQHYRVLAEFAKRKKKNISLLISPFDPYCYYLLERLRQPNILRRNTGKLESSDLEIATLTRSQDL